MSPRRATRTSYKPREGQKFTRQINTAWHDAEHVRIVAQAAESNVTPAEWVREAVRNALRAIYGD